MYGDVKFIISGSSYTTVPDRLPILGRQVYLSQFQPVGLQLDLVNVAGREYWDQIPRCSWPEGTASKCPQVLNLVAHQHSASNVGGTQIRDDPAKNNLLLESQNHSVASIIELFVSSLQKLK